MNHEKEWEEIINNTELMNREKGKLAMLCGWPIIVAILLSAIIQYP